MKRSIALMFVLAALGFSSLAAAPPQLINYQGVLRDASSAPMNGNFDMVFRFYSLESGGTLLLTDTHNSAAPSGQVAVSNGLFTIQLGMGTIAGGSEPDLAEMFRDNPAVWLETQVGTETLAPRVRVAASAYAQNASSLQGAVNVDGSGNVGICTQSPLAPLDVQGTVHMFGAWQDVTLDAAPVMALSDGFVVGYVAAQYDGDAGYMLGKTNNIRRASAGMHTSIEYNHYIPDNSFTMTVRKGEVYSVETNPSVGTPFFKAFWLPLGHAAGQIAEAPGAKAWPQGQATAAADPGSTGRADRSRAIGPGTVPEQGTVRNWQTSPLLQSMPVKVSVETGDILVFDPEDEKGVRPCYKQGDAMVAGVATQADPFAPARDDRYLPVAVAGVVHVKADATQCPIARGDLLVTSSNPGHAMKASVPVGSEMIVGKALEPLENGSGLISVLVMLR